MKKNIVVFIVFLGIIGIASRSEFKNEGGGEVPFTINPLDRKLVLSVQLDDSIKANLVFDTGLLDEAVSLDSTFCSEHSSILKKQPLDSISPAGSAWSLMSAVAQNYSVAPAVKLGKIPCFYEGMVVYNWKWYMATTTDGIFNIPPNDTTHVWELNFEHNYLKVHLSQNFAMPENCFTFPFMRKKASQPFLIKLPIKVECAGGDTLTLNRSFVIDTGIPWDIVLMRRAKELSFLNRQKDAVWTKNMANYYRHYTVRANVFETMEIDSLRIYTFDSVNRMYYNYLIGLNFLKRFNVFFDMKNQRLGLQPIPNFQRIVNPLRKRFHIGFTRTANGKIIVSKVADYEENYFKTAGFQEGDVVITVNGKPFNKLAPEDDAELGEQEVLHYDILRGGHPMKITVHVDKNEVQGD